MVIMTIRIRTAPPAIAPTIGAIMFSVEELLSTTFGPEVVASLKVEDRHMGSLKDCRRT